jgi:O-antigen biosynthesis protein WbqV
MTRKPQLIAARWRIAVLYLSVVKLLARSVVRVAALTLAYSIVSFQGTGLLELARTVVVIWPYLVVFGITGLAYDAATGSWRKSWRFTSLNDVLVMTRGATLIALALLLAVFVLDRGAALPRSVLFLAWTLDIGLFGGLLMLRRAVHEKTLAEAFAPFFGRGAPVRQPLMLIGSLESSDAFLRELNRESAPKYEAVGIIAAHAGDLRHEVRGVRAIGSVENADHLLQEFSRGEGDRAVLFLDGALAPADLDAELLARLKQRGVRLLRMNRVTDLDASLGSLSFRELDVNELLSRPPVVLDRERVRRLIAGKRVLVTGAGGSIGSEICRQVAALSCAHLAMVDHSEFGLFVIDQEVSDAFPTLSRAARIGNVRDGDRIRAIMVEERPEIVFHAAALKHVPLMEAHPSDSVLTNVIGSANVASAAIAAGASNFVFISTDKAVAPPNVMGATKRLAERAVCQLRRADGPRINVVRFGNVLGSAGSVVPTFLAQIARGGPVTLTHPDIERYFMTIPEAVQLVLHATAKSAVDDVEGVLVLDMGKPVRIIELARRLIELHGKTPGVDMEIRVTGLRPGEKMTEALFDVTETARECEPGLLEVVDDNAHVRLSEADLKQLDAKARAGDDAGVRTMLFALLDRLRAASTSNVTQLSRGV